MLSTAQMDFVENFIAQQYKEGYVYYVVFTNTNMSNVSSYNFRDLSIVVSKFPINCQNSYTFKSSNACVRYNIITRNASNNRDDDRIERLQKTNLSSLNLSINNYEFIITNATNSYHMNTLAISELNYRDNLTYNLDVNDYYTIPVCLCIIIVWHWLSSWFGRTKGELLSEKSN